MSETQRSECAACTALPLTATMISIGERWFCDGQCIAEHLSELHAAIAIANERADGLLATATAMRDENERIDDIMFPRATEDQTREERAQELVAERDAALEQVAALTKADAEAAETINALGAERDLLREQLAAQKAGR